MGRSSWYYGGHPPTCTCVRCNLKRLGRLQFGASTPTHRSSRRQRALRRPRRLWSAALRVVGLAAAVLALLTAGLAGFHWYKGASFESGFRMTIGDYRVAAQCREPHVILDFIDRSALESGAIALAKRLGANWVDEVCNGALRLLHSSSESDVQGLWAEVSVAPTAVGSEL